MPEDKYTVLTRDASGNAAWRSELERHNIRVYELPCIRTIPTDLIREVDETLSRIGNFHWIIFTSATGVRHFSNFATQFKIGPRTLTGVRLAAVGRQTADQIKALGLVVSFTPSRPNAITLARELKSVKNRQILIVRTNIAPVEPAEILRSRSAKVTELEVYQTVPVTGPDETLSQLLAVSEVARIIFASPSAVTSFCQRVTDIERKAAQMLPAIAVGQSVASALVTNGFQNVQTARTPNIAAIKDLIR